MGEGERGELRESRRPLRLVGGPLEEQTGDVAVSRKGLFRCVGASHCSHVSAPGRGLRQPSSCRGPCPGAERRFQERVLPVQNNFYAPVGFPGRLFLHRDNTLQLLGPCWLVTRPPGLGCGARV